MNLKTMDKNRVASRVQLLLSAALALLVLTSGGSRLWARQEVGGFVQTRPSEIHGTVVIRGCAPQASQIELRATPIKAWTDSRAVSRIQQTGSETPAHMVPTVNPHEFSFSIRGLQPASPYRLTIFLSPDICGRVFWRSQSQGLAVSGEDSVRIEGLAVTSNLEIRQAGTGEWMGAEAVDFTDAGAATRSLRWRSRLTGILGGELQISTSSFPFGDSWACDEPENGLLYRESVTAIQGEWSEIGPIDLNQIVARRLNVGDSNSPAGARNSTLRLLLAGAPLYARVVPFTSSGPACEVNEQGAPGWVILAKVPAGPFEPSVPDPAPPILEPGPRHDYLPPYFYRPSVYQPGKIFPSYDDRGFRTVKPHLLPSTQDCNDSTTLYLLTHGVPKSLIAAYADPIGCALVKEHASFSSTSLKVGDRFVIQQTFSTGGGGSLLDQFAPLVTGALNALALTVTSLADLYNDAVTFVKALAYDALLPLPGVGQLCYNYPEQCKKAIAAGLTYGMVAMGLPPSLPRWDQLKQEGIDYLASFVGEEIEDEIGVPSWMTEEAFHEAQKLLTQAAVYQMTNNRGGAAPKYSWFTRDAGFDPASWIVSVRKNGLDPVQATLHRFETPLFGGAYLDLPQTFPLSLFPIIDPTNPRFLRVPMVLTPNLADIPAPICFASWYTSPHQQCFGVLPPGSTPICLYQANTGASSPWKDDPDCIRYAELVGIYYRDAWAAKAAATSCTPLAAETLKRLGPFHLPWPGLTFVVGAQVPPFVPESWGGNFISACGGGS